MTAVELPTPNAAIRASRPLVSVIVPCFGEGRYLDDCLWSIRNQTYAQLEIIVIDDAGTDDSLAIALGHCGDPRVHVLRTERNVGLGAIRNIGIDLARGDLLAFVDGDDMLPPDSVRTRVTALASLLGDHDPLDGAAIAGVYGDWQYTTPDATIDQPLRASARLGAIDAASSGGGNIFTVSAPLVRRDIMQLAGGFAPNVAGGEDLLAWRRVLELGVVFLAREQVVHLYRQKPTSMLRAAGTEVAAFTVAARERVLAMGEPAAPPIPSGRGMQRLQAFHDGAYPMAWGKARRARTHMAAVGSPARRAAASTARAPEWATQPPSAAGESTGFADRIVAAAGFLAGAPPRRPIVPATYFARDATGGVVTRGAGAAATGSTSTELGLRPHDRLSGLRAGTLAARLAARGLAVTIAAGAEARRGVLDAWFVGGEIPDGVRLLAHGTPIGAALTLGGKSPLDEATAPLPDDREAGLVELLSNVDVDGNVAAIVLDADRPQHWISDAAATAQASGLSLVVGTDTSHRARQSCTDTQDIKALPLATVARAGSIISAGGVGAHMAELRETGDGAATAARYAAGILETIGAARPS